jgi:conjugative transposon TraN protein
MNQPKFFKILILFQMKKIICLITIPLLISCGDAYSQNFESIPSIPLMVSMNKTSNLIFPFAIKSVDIGSVDLLAQKANGIENVLQLKAAKENFDETNLSVITSDGKLYSFLIDYAANPVLLNLKFKDSLNNPISFSSENFKSLKSNDAKIELDANKILEQKRFLFGVKDKSNGMRLLLSGIYIDNDVLYFKLNVDNKTNINYDFESLNFFIKDIKQSKRTAVQEIQQTPLLVYNDSGFVKGKSSVSFVVADQKFTIPDKKMLVIQLMEKNGGRNLSLKIKNRTIVKAKTFSSD